MAIAHDSRLMADEFTDAAALCGAANGIKTYVFKSLRPVPELSFAVRTLGCIAGIVITASHNPREYYGYKVYWEDGAQVTPPHDTGIMAEVAKVTSFDMVKTMEKEKAQAEGLYQIISDDVDESYFAELRNLSIHPEIIKKMAKDIKIVYTPLHGTGLGPVKRVLHDLGFENVYIEPQQAVADGHFPTAPYPNPENPDAWELALKLAKEKDADLVLATDPDADRLGVYCKDTKSGEYVTFTGNMSAMLIAEYILGQKRANNTMPENPVLVESIVSTDMAKAIAKAYDVELVEVLTGLRKAESGKVTMLGKDVFNKTPKETFESGIYTIRADRKIHGLILEFSNEDNLILQHFEEEPYSSHGILNRKAIKEHSEELIEKYDVRPRGCAESPAGTLSGGNQQKVIFAKALLTEPSIWLCDEPTQAVDVATRQEIHRLLKEEAKKGKAVLYVSSDLTELLEVADEVAVMACGRVRKTFENNYLKPTDVLACCYEAEREENDR